MFIGTGPFLSLPVDFAELPHNAYIIAYSTVFFKVICLVCIKKAICSITYERRQITSLDISFCV